MDYTTANNIVVTNTPEANSSSVAEQVIASIFVFAKKIVKADQKTKAGYKGKIVGNLIRDKKLGILGLGKIGKCVALAARGLGMEVLAHDVQKDFEFAHKNDIKYVVLAMRITSSDFITCHIPLNSQTKDLLSIEEFSQMKNSVCLTNTSR